MAAIMKNDVFRIRFRTATNIINVFSDSFSDLENIYLDTRIVYVNFL